MKKILYVVMVVGIIGLVSGIAGIGYGVGNYTGWCKGYEEGKEIGLVQYEVAWSNLWWKAYPNSVKETPWDDFNIEQKMLLCAYGSSGNKLNSADMFKVFRTYGTETAASEIVDFTLVDTDLTCPKCIIEEYLNVSR